MAEGQCHSVARQLEHELVCVHESTCEHRHFEPTTPISGVGHLPKAGCLQWGERKKWGVGGSGFLLLDSAGRHVKGSLERSQLLLLGRHDGVVVRVGVVWTVVSVVLGVGSFFSRSGGRGGGASGVRIFLAKNNTTEECTYQQGVFSLRSIFCLRVAQQQDRGSVRERSVRFSQGNASLESDLFSGKKPFS